MARGGYIKAWRSMHDNPVLRGDLAANMTFRFYIEAAAHRETPWDVAGMIVRLQPGEWFGTLSQVENITGLSTKQIRRAETLLSASGMIEVRSQARKGRLVSVTNYSRYQGSDEEQGRLEGTAQGRPRERLRERQGRRKKEEHIEGSLRSPSLPGLGVADRARAVLERWNKKYGRKFRAQGTGFEKLQARIKQGATDADCQLVITEWTARWARDPERAQYLQPSTLFNKKFFERLESATNNPIANRKKAKVSGPAHRRVDPISAKYRREGDQ